MRKKRQGGFTLLEMLIVILVVAALATQFLPDIMMSEVFINTSADDYNQASALRYVAAFKSLNEKFPSGFHTGLQENAANAQGMPNMTLDMAYNFADGVTQGLATGGGTNNVLLWNRVNRFPWELNFAGAGATDAVALTNVEANSMAKAGIVALAYGPDGAGTKLPFETLDAACVVKKFETPILNNLDILVGGLYDEVTNDITAPTTSITFGGQDLAAIVGATDTAVILFVGPEIVWDYYYNFDGTTADNLPDFVADGTGSVPDPDAAYTWSGESRLGISVPPRSPKMSKGSWNYYACVFKVDNTTPAADSDKAYPAQLIGTLNPELESINP